MRSTGNMEKFSKNLVFRNLKKDFCEELVENYNKLLNKLSDSLITSDYDVKQSIVMSKIENKIENMSENIYLLYLTKRVRITDLIVKKLEEMRRISCALYSDKIMNLPDPIRKKSSFDLKNLTFPSKFKNQQRLSLCLSKIKV